MPPDIRLFYAFAGAVRSCQVCDSLNCWNLHEGGARASVTWLDSAESVVHQSEHTGKTEEA